MDDVTRPSLSPYQHLTVAEWARLRADTPMTLDPQEIDRLKSLGDPMSVQEVEQVYLPLSRLLSLHVEASQSLFEARSRFLGVEHGKTPFIIGIAGSVAVGKSTTARILKALLGRWPTSPHVELVTTDGFLYPNAVLQRKGLLNRKGFPESYDVAALLSFLSAIKAGQDLVEAPVYSHLTYDVVPDQVQRIAHPDVLILEGLNVLQSSALSRDGEAAPFVSDFFDFSIYLDANEADIERWYIERFMQLRETRFRDPQSYFSQYAQYDEGQAKDIARQLWATINRVNLEENILPTRPRASLILSKGPDHAITHIAWRRI